jgi:hypothetical protein
VRLAVWLLAAAALAGCRVLTGGLGAPAGTADAADTATIADQADGPPTDGWVSAVDVGEPPGVGGAPLLVGCSDGTREGFRNVAHWPAIAGCAGAFDQPGVIGSPAPSCDRQAGDTSVNPAGIGCGAPDLCAEHWHLCRDGVDVAQHSPTGGCESCVPAGEPRFFLVAAGASSMGICSPDREASNDLHGCGGLGQPESDACAPLLRRMGFADCLATGAWSCGTASDSLREAAVVTKPGLAMGGALCCRD